jgi:hypothetical protein
LFGMAYRDDNIDLSTTEIAGGCLCGAVRYRLTNTPRVHYCHCDMCRRATGSAFAVLAWVPFDALSWTSGRPKYRRSSPLAERGFCESCGTPLTLAYDSNRGELALHAGTLDAPERFEPRYNYGARQRLGWVCCGIDLPDRNTEERW